jgi:AraC-like DNA-binding protein
MNLQNVFTRNSAFSIDYLNSGKESRKPIGDSHDSFELAFFIRADIDIFVEDTKYHIQDGDILLINPFDIHRIFYNPNHDYTRYVLQFKASFIHDLLVAMGLLSLQKALQLKKNKRVSLDIKTRIQVEERFRVLLESYSHLPLQGEDLLCEAVLKQELILLLIKYDSLSKAQRPLRVSRQLDQQMREIIYYIDEQYMNPIQLEDLEQIFGKSKYYISHFFRESTRFTVIEYLQYRRVVEAQKKLVLSPDPIIEIGFDCGFQSLQHFYRVFKKISGKTPAQYRKENRS